MFALAKQVFMQRQRNGEMHTIGQWRHLTAESNSLESEILPFRGIKLTLQLWHTYRFIACVFLLLFSCV